MIVARSFSPPKSSLLSEKNDLVDLNARSFLRQRSKSPRRSSTASSTRTPSTSSSKSRSDPVKIPTRNNKHAAPQTTTTRSMPIAVAPPKSSDAKVQAYRQRKQSAQEILSATAIPRRKHGRQSQRLPKGNHVADFSKLLFEDIQQTKDGASIRTHYCPNVDELFGHIDELVEGQLFITGDSIDEGSLSARSISSDSLASLGSPDDFGSSHVERRSTSMGRSTSVGHLQTISARATPRISHAEDCTTDHPLAHIDDIDELSLNSSGDGSAPTTSANSRSVSPLPRAPAKKESSRSGFKSTLTSSLKALTSAARTTFFSPYSGSSSNLYSHESLLAHNFFDIQPSLTDDRRPPPTVTKPSPELRRYLNPKMSSVAADSPTQLHFWQDERYVYDAKREMKLFKEKAKQKYGRRRSPGPRSKIDSLPRVVPLSTCLPPTVRTATASSPPVWLTPEGEPVNKNAGKSSRVDTDTPIVNGNGMPRNREPRENRDFLRMYVCEAAMRRSGKLSDDLAAGRARLWLPPSHADGRANRKLGADRWKSWTADDAK